jgi:hypothetical protein
VSEDKITLKIDSVDKLTEHWIAEGERIATERIIKLLEDKRYLCSTEKACWENLDSGCECPELIALIKGEK